MLPTVAEVLALDPLRRGAPRVVAAADGLGAPVRWVHVIELAEAAHLLRGGELVLSTGIALPDDPSGLTRYVAGFADATAELLTWDHRVAPEDWWQVYRSSVGSNGLVIARQDDATIARIKAEFGRLAARYATGDGMVALPAAAILASGTRPGAES